MTKDEQNHSEVSEPEETFVAVYYTSEDWTVADQIKLEATFDVLCEGMGLEADSHYQFSNGTMVSKEDGDEKVVKMVRENGTANLGVRICFSGTVAPISIAEASAILNFLSVLYPHQIFVTNVFYGDMSKINIDSLFYDGEVCTDCGLRHKQKDIKHEQRQ